MNNYSAIAIIVSTFKCLLLLFPLSFLLGYGVLNLLAIGSTFLDDSANRFKFPFEDTVVASLAALSLLIISTKLLNIFPQIEFIFYLIVGIIIVSWAFSLIYCLIFQKKLNLITIQRPSLKFILLWLAIVFLYIVKSWFKARSLSEAVYFPTRHNGDILLYLRRISVFLADSPHSDLNFYGVSALDVLYDSPKLLSSLVYAAFTFLCNDPGIAATILISLILSGIITKYTSLAQKDSSNQDKIIYIILIFYLIAQPSLSWLTDNFYLSNILYIYLLIYTWENLFIFDKFSHNTFLKYLLAVIVIAGFYPSQVVFFSAAFISLVFLFPAIRNQLKKIYAIRVLLTTIIISLVFVTQYIETTEVVHHFNISDSSHGFNLAYVPFWSILDLPPRLSGFKQDIGFIILVLFSNIIAFCLTRYLRKIAPILEQHFNLIVLLYFLYSLSFLLLPGSYRQGKFFLTYIVPLALFCFVKLIFKPEVVQKTMLQVLFIGLTVYVTYGTLVKTYMPRISQKIQTIATHLQTKNQPVIVYSERQNNKVYYYLGYQLKNLKFEVIYGCPSPEDLAASAAQAPTILVSSTCNSTNLENTSMSEIIYID